MEIRQTAQPNISKKLRIYKNLNLISSINLNIFGPYDYLGSFATDANGTMYLVTNPSGLPNRLNKITLNGDHTSVIIPDLAGSIQMFNSGKLLLYFDGGQVNIYNPDLTLYSSNTNIGYETDYYPRLFATGNYIFLQSFHGDMARIINEDAQEVAEVQIQGSLSPLYSKGFLNGDIITTGNFGNQLNIYTEYSWSRGFIHKYNIEQALLLNPESPESYDTGITIYPNPSTGIVNFKTPAGIVITKAELYDLTGKLLFETKTSYIDLTGLNTAIYLLRIVTADDAMTFKIIKNN
ncbi:MAG: T9SS type A sorting domain-containing protein [Flavobacterium sp.]|nr:MAG: T9SS type A sorting domain-containing protein [Flavobacterium sp.]